MPRNLPQKDDDEVVPLRLDQVTLSRLARLGRLLGEHPLKLATALLHDILEDEDFLAQFPGEPYSVDPSSLN